MPLNKIEQLLQHYREMVQQGGTDNRVPLEIDNRLVGSLAPEHAELLAGKVQGLDLSDDTLSVLPVCAPDAPAALRVIADVLRDAGLAPHWRNELLPVCADDGTLVGAVERACVRVLGVRTFAVHLSGQIDIPDPTGYRVWLQRRAADKSVDPGMLDTLAGGLIGMQGTAMEPLRLGLQREVAEEAGLEPGQYESPTHLQTVRMQWQVPEGYFEEDCIVFHARVTADTRPVNRDGEVAEFMQADGEQLLALIERGELTETASIASLLAMRHAMTDASL